MPEVFFTPRPRSGRSLAPALRGFCLLALLSVSQAVCVFGQSTSYHVVKIVDNLTIRPDDPAGTATFQFNNGFGSAPRLDAGVVVFRVAENESIWQANAADGSGLLKLVDESTPCPGGAGNFMELGIRDGADQPLIKDGTIIFPGESPTSNQYVFLPGLYSVPVGGGAVKKIVDGHTVVPDGNGGVFTAFGNPNAQSGNFTVSNGQIAFSGSDDGTSNIFLADVDGSGLKAIADTKHVVHPTFLFPVDLFSYPAIANGVVAFYGGTTEDASNGYNALYTTTGGFVYDEVTTSNAVLPGDKTASPHTRFDAGTPPLVFDGAHLVFVADDADSPDGVAARAHFTGLYTLPAAGGAPVRLLDNTVTPAGLEPTTTYEVTGLSLDGGLLAFSAADGDGNYGLYVTKADGSGPIVRVLGTGDPLDDGSVVQGLGLIDGGFSGGSIAVQLSLAYGHTNGGAAGIYVVAPGAGTPVVTIAADVPKVTEDGGVPASFLIVRSGDASTKIKVHYKVTGSAEAGVDYEALNGKAKLGPGKASKEVFVSPIDHHQGGGGKVKVKLTLVPGAGYIVGTPATAKVKIVEND